MHLIVHKVQGHVIYQARSPLASSSSSDTHMTIVGPLENRKVKILLTQCA